MRDRIVSRLNPITQRRLRVFLRNRIAMSSLALLLIGLLASFAAELIANDKPYVLKYHGKLYFPIFSTPTAMDLGIPDTFRVEFSELALGPEDWMVRTPVRYNPFQTNAEVESFPSPPSWQNPLGTDDRGRDIFARLLYGFRISFFYAVGTWIVTYIIGVVFGLTMGFFGGRIDFLGQRVVEVLSSVPQFFLLIILVSIFDPSMGLLIAITSLFGWIPISLYVRAEGLRLRKLDFVEAARAVGLPAWRVVLRHVLPNALTPIITFSPFAIAAGITGLAALDYLGFGLAPPTPSWGELLNQAKKYITSAWWLAVFPSASLFAALTLLNFVGEGLRNAFDPKQ